MNARVIKEFRPLLFPGCLIALCAALSLAMPWAETLAEDSHARGVAISFIGVANFVFFIGIALLAAISFGSEFQQRTFVLLLTQPMERVRIWRDKIVTAAVIIAAITALQACTPESLQLGKSNNSARLVLLAFAFTVICSATYWTLIARSTIGGVAFILMAIFVGGTGTWLIFDKIVGPTMPLQRKTDLLCITLALVAIPYSLTLLWLGWRKFAQMEARDILTGEEMALPHATPGIRALAGLLRCRPNTPTTNLIRKELRLQRPAFLIAALFTVSWLLTLGMFFIQLERKSMFDNIFNILTAFYIPLIALLVGCISLGEEKTLGLGGWHLTLPPSSRKQWLIKLLTMLGSVLLLGVVLPSLLALMTLVKTKIGLVHLFKDEGETWSLLGMLCLLSLVSFWASTLTGHSVRAALLTVVTCVAITFMVTIASWVSDLAGGLQTTILNHLTFSSTRSPDRFISVAWQYHMWAIVIALCLTTLIQSFRYFRGAHTFESIPLKPFLTMLFAMLVASLWGSDLYTSARNSSHAIHNEMAQAFNSLSLSEIASTPLRERVPITLDQLERDKPLPPKIHNWLKNAEIEIFRTADRLGAEEYWQAIIKFPDGAGMSYRIGPKPSKTSLHTQPEATQ